MPSVPHSNDLHFQSLTQLRDALDNKQISASELAQTYLDRIQTYQPLNAFLHIDPELTLRQAKTADRKLAQGERSPLLGLPIAHKDVIVTRGWRSTAASKMLANYYSPFDATVVERLATQGMVCLGKTNCDEFAMGSSNENSAFGAVQNPWAPDRIPGGSSGGSAAAIAAGLAPAATGTDTGGSIRQPAAMCGITGIKPSYGRVSRYGLIAYASSLDQAGPMARTAQDCAILLNTMAGFDSQDSTSIERPAEDFSRLLDSVEKVERPLQGLRIGVPQEFFSSGLDDEVAQAVKKALQTFEQLGAHLIDISLPRTALSIPAYYVIAPAEASSNLSRFDAVRYGHRSAEFHALEDMQAISRSEAFGVEVQRRILLGTYVLSHGYYDAYYVQAQKLRRLIAQDFQAAFESKNAQQSTTCDVIMGPVAPSIAWKLGEKKNDPVANYLSDIFTLGVSLAGLPAMSIPCGFSDATPQTPSCPIGLQLIGNYFDEARLLSIAHAFQQNSNWHLRHPIAFVPEGSGFAGED